jgi:hypothetical protein
VELLREARTRQQRRSVVLTAVLGHDGKGRADGVVPVRGSEGRADDVVLRPFDVEQERSADVGAERGTSVGAHVEDTKEGVQWRWMQRRRGRWRVCGRKMTGLGFRDSDTLKKKNSSDGHDDVINIRHYI